MKKSPIRKLVIYLSMALIATLSITLITLNLSTMKHLKTEIILNASSEQVWNILTTFDEYENWNPFIVSLSGEAALGKQLKAKMMNKGKANIFKPVITKFEKNKNFEWLGSGLMGMFKGRHYFMLEDLGNGQTKLIHGEKFSGLLSGLIMKMIGEDTLRNFQTMNKAIKDQLERYKTNS